MLAEPVIWGSTIICEARALIVGKKTREPAPVVEEGSSTH
jgi:hypothetical protein